MGAHARMWPWGTKSIWVLVYEPHRPILDLEFRWGPYDESSPDSQKNLILQGPIFIPSHRSALICHGNGRPLMT